MADVASSKTLTLSEQYLLKDKEEKPDVASKVVDVKEDEKPATAVSEEVVAEKVEETLAAAVEEKTEDTHPAADEESAETDSPTADSSSQDAPAVEESNEAAVEEDSAEEAAAEEPEIKLETAPADFRFPTTNQTRHCFTRYIEYHRCIAAKGEGSPECDKFAKYYRSLCPGEWVDRWNEQRENGTFPGPL